MLALSSGRLCRCGAQKCANSPEPSADADAGSERRQEQDTGERRSTGIRRHCRVTVQIPQQLEADDGRRGERRRKDPGLVSSHAATGCADESKRTHLQSKVIDAFGTTDGSFPAETETGGLFPAGTAVKHPERGLGFVVEVVRQGEQRPWRVLYDSGRVSRYALAAMHTLTQAFVDGMQNDGRSDRRREEKMMRSLKLEPEVGIVCSYATDSEHVNVNWDDSKNNRTTPRDPRPPTPPRGRPSTPAPPTPKGLPRTPRGLSSTLAPPTPRTKFRRPSVVETELGQIFETADNEGPTVYGNSEAPGKSGTRNPMWKGVNLVSS